MNSSQRNCCVIEKSAAELHGICMNEGAVKVQSVRKARVESSTPPTRSIARTDEAEQLRYVPDLLRRQRLSPRSAMGQIYVERAIR